MNELAQPPQMSLQEQAMRQQMQQQRVQSVQDIEQSLNMGMPEVPPMPDTVAGSAMVLKAHAEPARVSEPKPVMREAVASTIPDIPDEWEEYSSHPGSLSDAMEEEMVPQQSLAQKHSIVMKPGGRPVADLLSVDVEPLHHFGNQVREQPLFVQTADGFIRRVEEPQPAEVQQLPHQTAQYQQYFAQQNRNQQQMQDQQPQYYYDERSGQYYQSPIYSREPLSQFGQPVGMVQTPEHHTIWEDLHQEVLNGPMTYTTPSNPARSEDFPVLRLPSERLSDTFVNYEKDDMAEYRRWKANENREFMRP